MKTPPMLSRCIGRIIDQPVRLFGYFINKTIGHFFRSYRCGQFSSEMVPAFMFQQGKLVPVRVDIRKFM
ncbi:MAG: hypothetical protein D3909_01930 [Candidatus Electrothrix sp. ATG1]|nr:hypothetical protein [Candidatus Electrothrix sp. ATG1]